MEENREPIKIRFVEVPTSGDSVLFGLSSPISRIHNAVKRELVIGGRRQRVLLVLLDDEDEDSAPTHNPNPPRSKVTCPDCGHKF